MAVGALPRDQNDEAEVFSREQSPVSWGSVFSGLISVRPLEASPNQIVLVGWSPAPHGSFFVRISSCLGVLIP